jgi:hypothetical protein
LRLPPLVPNADGDISVPPAGFKTDTNALQQLDVPIVTLLSSKPRCWPVVPVKVMFASSPLGIVTVVAGPPIEIVPVTIPSSRRMPAAGSNVNANGDATLPTTGRDDARPGPADPVTPLAAATRAPADTAPLNATSDSTIPTRTRRKHAGKRRHNAMRSKVTTDSSQLPSATGRTATTGYKSAATLIPSSDVVNGLQKRTAFVTCCAPAAQSCTPSA